jgi:hypothetical protein
MKRFVVCSWAVLSASLLLDAQLTVPGLGLARFSDGSVHPISGVSANLIVEPQAIATAASASFSDSVGLIYANGLIQLMRIDGTVLGEYRTDEPQPLLNINGPAQSAAVWLPSKRLLLHWNGTKFEEIAIDDSLFGGRVTFVRLASNTSVQFFAVQTNSSVTQISVALPSARVTSLDNEPGANGAIFVQQGWRFSQDEYGLIAERFDGSRQSIALSKQPLPANDLLMEQMSDHWLHVSSRSTGAGWAVFVSVAKFDVSLLPPPVTEAKR